MLLEQVQECRFGFDFCVLEGFFEFVYLSKKIHDCEVRCESHVPREDTPVMNSSSCKNKTAPLVCICLDLFTVLI